MPQCLPTATTEAASKPLPAPRCLDVEVTTRCNIGCRYCYLGRPGVDDMKLETAWKVSEFVGMLDESQRRRSPIELNLYGGEPFLNWPAVHLLSSAAWRSHGASVTIFTNGVTASEDQVAWCRQHGVRAKRSSAGCPESAALTRPGGYTDRWISEGRWWGDLGDTHRIAVTPATAGYVCRNVRWLQLQGYYGPVDFAPDDYAYWDNSSTQTYEDQMKRLASEVVVQAAKGKVLAIENFRNFGRAIFGQSDATVLGCGACWNTVGVTWNGYIVPCHRFLREYRSPSLCGGHLASILAGNPIQFGRGLTDAVSGWQSGVERAECHACDARQSCPRGCLHVSYMMRGGFNQSTSLRCRITRLYAQLARWINEQTGDGWWKANPTPAQPFAE